MAIPANTAYEIRPTNGVDTNGAGFVLSGPTYATDLAATVATSAAPVCTSATYNFVAGDVGSYLYIKSGTNWTPGLYQIASVASNAATLSQACATVASPTSGTWSVDYSQQNSAQYSDTDLVLVTSTTLTSASHAFGVNMVGNILNITAGTGFTTGRYVINSVSGVTATVDRSAGTGGSTSGTGAIGGAGKTIPNIITDWANNGTQGGKMFVKAEATISTTATITINPPAGTPTQAIMPNRIIGYTNSRTDGGKVTVQLSTNTGLTCFNCTTDGNWIENFTFDANSLGTSSCIKNTSAGQGRSLIRNCIMKNFTTGGVSDAAGANGITVSECEITNGTSAATAAIANGSQPTRIWNCYIHDNVCPGVIGITGSISFCLITNNSGASSDGIQLTGGASMFHGASVFNNTIYNNGRDGIRITAAQDWDGWIIKNNILVKNGGYGINISVGAGIPAVRNFDGNAYGTGAIANTSGSRNNADDTSTNLINLVAPYTNTLDVTLTVDPFTSSSTSDFTLNNKSGGGAACRGSGTPGTILNATGTGYLDMGCFQHQDTPSIITQRKRKVR